MTNYLILPYKSGNFKWGSLETPMVIAGNQYLVGFTYPQGSLRKSYEIWDRAIFRSILGQNPHFYHSQEI